MLLLPPLESLRFFEAAARHQSFVRAAKELEVTSAAVAHRVRMLEKQATGRVETAGSPINFFVFSTLLPFLSLRKTVSSRNRQKTGPSWPAP